jgi:hypothetical protein
MKENHGAGACKMFEKNGFSFRNVGFGGRVAPIIRAWAFGSNEEWFLPRQGKLPAISV